MYLGDSPVKALVRKTRLEDDQDGTVLCLPDPNQVYLLMLAQKPCIWEQSRKSGLYKMVACLGPMVKLTTRPRLL